MLFFLAASRSNVELNFSLVCLTAVKSNFYKNAIVKIIRRWESNRAPFEIGEILNKIIVQALDKKRKFSLSISSANVTKSTDADLAIFTEEIHNGKLHFLCSEMFKTCDNPAWRAAKNFLE